MGYEILRLENCWLLIIGGDQLKRGLQFSKYIDALETVELLGFEIRVEDKTLSRFQDKAC